MNLQEGIEKLKELLFKNETPTVELKFKEAKLNDGTTIVQYDADVLATGVIVNIMDEAGQLLPLPVGDYVLEDGTTFSVVNETGAIDKVVLAPEAPENEGEVVAPAKDAPVAQASAPVVPSAPKRVIKSQVEEHVFSLEIEGYEPIAVDFSSMFTKLNAENESLKTDLAKEKDLNKQMFSIVKEIADAPASQPTETKEKFSVARQKELFKQTMQELEGKMSNDNL
jgi:hypothetical protein